MDNEWSQKYLCKHITVECYFVIYYICTYVVNVSVYQNTVSVYQIKLTFSVSDKTC